VVQVRGEHRLLRDEQDGPSRNRRHPATPHRLPQAHPRLSRGVPMPDRNCEVIRQAQHPIDEAKLALLGVRRYVRWTCEPPDEAQSRRSPDPHGECTRLRVQAPQRGTRAVCSQRTGGSGPWNLTSAGCRGSGSDRRRAPGRGGQMFRIWRPGRSRRRIRRVASGRGPPAPRGFGRMRETPLR
jgi:hypothetical protein